jgi:hypothetical protein
VAWFRPCLLCKRWKGNVCLFPSVPENAGFTVFSLCEGVKSELLHIENLRRKQECIEVVMACVYFHAPYTPAWGSGLFLCCLYQCSHCESKVLLVAEKYLELIVYPAGGAVEERVLLTFVQLEGQTELDFISRC